MKRRWNWPVLCSLLIALLLRLWLVAHAGGVVNGDEALVGIQAQHILRGERPIYFYGQVYMGSLEAYLIALLFALFGSSAWALRAEPIILSLLIVWLTCKLAALLASALPPMSSQPQPALACRFVDASSSQRLYFR